MPYAIRGTSRQEPIDSASLIDMLAREKWQISTLQVLEAVFEERVRQVARYGQNETLEDGTGPEECWADPYVRATTTESIFRTQYERVDAAGELTWMHLIREEVAEAFAEDDSVRLEEELVQVAALCVSWIEKIRARA